jgi:hypothetical protein
MRFLIAATVLALTGCVAPYTRSPLATSPVITSSDFEPVATVTGVGTYLDSTNKDVLYYLRSFVSKKGLIPASHQLYVDHTHTGDWVFWERANDASARPMEFREIGRKVVGCHGECVEDEAFSVILTDSLVRKYANANEPLLVKFYAKTGKTMVIPVMPGQLASTLRITDSLAQAFKHNASR